MKIPHVDLSPKALQSVVEEFVTRDGTDHSDIKQRVVTILKQLADGNVELHFDDLSQSCTIKPTSS